ncbi:MAG: formylmethanofuran dehydrogenase subunit C [Methanomicrobiaceae archaeon]|uniref:Formylmethanofuran dehydrogenase (Tungsten) subunit c n=1 Tax=hydrocarbon metagenome TaxID=938273 RepID=A0A0W8FJD5_9ZZZZ|nr:formylmethanofuran dehydrogenase subunit C [Methanomicrobiaceae archaeon]MDD5420094.1 formylmethanofuran dehydrogenase subunit C [Methanomicrobiaceae archaeon]
MRVTLQVKPRKKPFLPIEAETIVPAHFLDGTDLVVWKGNRELPLSDVFSVTVEGTAETADEVEITMRGDTSRIKRVGEYMEAGRIVIEDDIGMHCGNFMSGGTIEIGGNADGWLAREMRGGSIICRGNAGNYCASGYRGEKRGMTGGTVEVFGNVGDFAAETLAGGCVVIHGSAGDMAGTEMRGGTLRIEGDCTRVCGNMTAGTCYVFGTVHDMLPTFRRRGTAVHDGVTLTAFTGDIANRGKGNLFVRDYKYMD